MENPEALLVWVGLPQKLHGLGGLEKENELIKINTLAMYSNAMLDYLTEGLPYKHDGRRVIIVP